MDTKEVEQLLAGLRSRGEIKRLGARADRDPALRSALAAIAAARGVAVDAGAAGKRLVRAALARSDAAQVRQNPIHRDEAFDCTWCGVPVAPGGAPVRDHCPRCLRSLHVDVVPGDRANPCGGVLHPSRFELVEGTFHIRYTCGRCGGPHRVRAHPDDALPPSLDPSDLPGRPPAPSAPSRTLPQRVLGFIRQHQLWSPGQRVTVAVSGGVDSTVLLEVLARTAGAHGGRLEVVSLDHGFRPESPAEVAQVRTQAERLGLPFSTTTLSIPPGPNLYARARDARRAALQARGADRIATGHHEDDQAETVLHHLLRGAGSRGLRGMVPLSAPWCRPLLATPRAEVVAWAKQEGLEWCEDLSNADSQRGALRRLIPALDAIRGSAGAALARSGRLLAREDDLLSTLTDHAEQRCAREGGLSLAALHAEHPALQLRLLRRLTSGCPKPVRADQLEAVLIWSPQGGARLPLPAGWSLHYRHDVLSVETPLKRKT